MFTIPSDAYRSIMTLSERDSFAPLWRTYGTYTDYDHSEEEIDVEKAEERPQTEETMSEKKGFSHDTTYRNSPQ